LLLVAALVSPGLQIVCLRMSCLSVLMLLFLLLLLLLIQCVL